MVLSPAVESLEHGSSLADHSRNEGLRRRRRSVYAAAEGVASAWALTRVAPHRWHQHLLRTDPRKWQDLRSARAAMACDGYSRIAFVISDRLKQVQFTRRPASFERSKNGLRLSFQ